MHVYFLFLFNFTLEPKRSLAALTTKKVEIAIKFPNAKEYEGAKKELESCHATKEGRMISHLLLKVLPIHIHKKPFHNPIIWAIKLC
jgi:hypothetical protein